MSDGKSKVASAITAKGVSTKADATFDDMSINIGKISTTTNFTYVAGAQVTLDYSQKTRSVSFSYTTQKSGQFIFILGHSIKLPYTTGMSVSNLSVPGNIIFDIGSIDGQTRIWYGTVDANQSFKGTATSSTTTSYDHFGFYLYMM